MALDMANEMLGGGAFLRNVINKTLQEGFKEDEFKKAVGAWLQQRKIGLGADQGLAGRLAAYMRGFYEEVILARLLQVCGDIFILRESFIV